MSSRVAFAGLVCAMSVAATSQTLFKTGFEPGEGYVFGVLLGQKTWQCAGSGGQMAAGVVPAEPSFGAQSLLIDSTTIHTAFWWWTYVPYDSATSAKKVVRLSWDFKQDLAGLPRSENASSYGIDLSDGSGSKLLGSLFIDGATGRAAAYDSSSGFRTLGDPWAESQWHHFGATLDFGSKRIDYDLDGFPLARGLSLDVGDGKIGDLALFCDDAGWDRGYLDAIRLEAVSNGTARLWVGLSDFVGSVGGTAIRVEIRNPGTTTLVEPARDLVLDADGRATFATAQRGVFDIAIKGSHFLRTVLPNVEIADIGFFDRRASLFNGDVDSDNVISVFDYNLLSAAFDSTASSTNWNPNADLDGDGHVTVYDYGVLSENFDRSGEP